MSTEMGESRVAQVPQVGRGAQRMVALRKGRIVLLWTKTDFTGTTRRRATGQGQLNRQVGEGAADG